jgi:uncharacterized protein YxeA
MKKIILLVTGFIFNLTIIAQGNKGVKGQGKVKSKNEISVNHSNKDQKEKEAHNKKVWDGTSDRGGMGPKYSKNQPAKVRAAFQRDYPNARYVSWSKYRGDWTATFGNGLYMSTAIYHANGERRDTRTTITKNEIPRNVLDSIFKRRPATRFDDIIKIDVPSSIREIFRIKDVIQGKPEYSYYNSNGLLVNYNY